MRIDLAGVFAAFDCRVVVRGCELVLLPPHMVKEDVDLPVADRPRAWPGLLPFVWRCLAGEPRARADGLERMTILHAVTAVTQPGDRWFVESLSTAELVMVLAAYQGSQQAWVSRMAEDALDQCRSATQVQAPLPVHPQPGPGGSVSPDAANAARASRPSPVSRGAMVPLVYGDRLPAWMGGGFWGEVPQSPHGGVVAEVVS